MATKKSPRKGKRRTTAKPLTDSQRREMVRALIASGRQGEFDFCPPREKEEPEPPRAA